MRNRKTKTIVSFAWLTCPVTEQETVLALTILEIVLTDTDAAPLKAALLKSKLCKQVVSSIDDEMSEIPIVLTLKGCKESDVDALDKLIRKTLSDVVKKGIPAKLIDSAMHQLEFHRTEITGDDAPYGLTLFMRSALLQQHGVPPERALKIHSLFDGLRARLKEHPDYLTSLISTYFLDNTHAARVVLIPDPLLGAKEEELEHEALEAIKSKLTADQKKKIVSTAQQLLTFQEHQETQDLSVLPKVSLSDVPQHAVNMALREKWREI